jgi:hypothetical protein
VKSSEMYDKIVQLKMLWWAMNMQLPKQFLAFLQNSKPKEGELSVDPWWYQIWPTEEIEELNKSYEVVTNAPSFIGFGSSGGGEMLAFNATGQVYMIPFIGMCDADAKLIADSWEAFEKLM